MRYMSRPFAFALSLSLGTAAWYILSYRIVTADAPVQSNRASAVQTSTPTPSRPQPTPERFIRLKPVQQLNGFANTTTLTLRQSPDASATIVASVKMSQGVGVEILEVTRDFIHVKFPAPEGSKNVGGEHAGKEMAEYEGWATWGAVIPNMSAIVLDADTGRVVSRVPLGDLHTSVAFSPDGSRAIFYRTGDYGGSMVASESSTESQPESVLAYEVTTDDYALTRCVVSAGSHLLGPLFYSPVDGTLAAFGGASVDAEAKLSLMRLGDFYTVDMPTEISAAATTFAVSPDGLTGFIWHPQDSDGQVVTVDVVDLQTLNIRSTLSLTNTQLTYPDQFAINRDGSEIYLQPSEDKIIRVINTWTGQLVRELRTKLTKNDWVYFSQENLVGDSLLIRYWNEGADEMHSEARMAWLSSAGRVAAEGEIERAVEAGGTRYAVNAEGTRLFRLDKKNQIQERLPIERPEIRQRKEAEFELTTHGLATSPDGKHIIVFVGLQEDGC